MYDKVKEIIVKKDVNDVEKRGICLYEKETWKLLICENANENQSKHFYVDHDVISIGNSLLKGNKHITHIYLNPYLEEIHNKSVVND